MRVTHWIIFSLTLVMIVMLITAACGGGARPDGENGKNESTGEVEDGDAERGERIFIEGGEGVVQCAACHSLEEGVRLVGPSMARIGAAAAERVAGQSAEEYLRESILDPNAFVVEGYPKDIMPPNYGAQLDAQDLADVLEFLLGQ